MKFVDEIRFFVSSGRGGDGCVAFRREAHVPRGGPAGGDGGRGGSVIFESTRSRNTLVDYRRNKLYKAPSGRAGMGSSMTGASGEDLTLLVPVGTMLYNEETDELLADLDVEGARYVVPGGSGGLGNIHFKSSTRRTPTFALPGRDGVELSVRLELKLIADVGLLGFPNAGKSTFISAVSAARPKVADYPFTTLVPNLGVVSVDVGKSFLVADIPGLIEGASEGQGLGHQFLRHVERCRFLLHLVAPDHPDHDPTTLLTLLNAELEAYNPELRRRPQMVVLTKTDLMDEEEREFILEELRELTQGPVWSMSSVSQDGLRPLVHAMWRALEHTTSKAESTDE